MCLCFAVVPQPVYSNMSELAGEGESSPHGSLSSSGYGSQPSVRNHEDLPTVEGQTNFFFFFFFMLFSSLLVIAVIESLASLKLSCSLIFKRCCLY